MPEPTIVANRVILSEPLPGRLGNVRVRVIDLGLGGAALEHGGAVPIGEVSQLVIEAGHSIRVRARPRYSQLRRLSSGGSPALFQTGVEFVEMGEDVETMIESVLLKEARYMLTEWQANLTGTRRSSLPTLTSRDRQNRPQAFYWYRYLDGRWVRTVSRTELQPVDGFAVCDDEDPAQVELLCKAYERYDEDDRYMLRMMAQIAISERLRSAQR